MNEWGVHCSMQVKNAPAMYIFSQTKTTFLESFRVNQLATALVFYHPQYHHHHHHHQDCRKQHKETTNIPNFFNEKFLFCNT